MLISSARAFHQLMARNQNDIQIDTLTTWRSRCVLHHPWMHGSAGGSLRRDDRVPQSFSRREYVFPVHYPRRSSATGGQRWGPCKGLWRSIAAAPPACLSSPPVVDFLARLISDPPVACICMRGVSRDCKRTCSHWLARHEQSRQQSIGGRTWRIDD